MKLKRSILFVLLSIVCYTVKAQNSTDSLTIDSLKKVLPQAKEDTNKVNMLNELSGKLTHNRDKAKQYANAALQLAQKLKFKNGEGMAYYHYGSAEAGLNYYGEKGEFKQVLEYFEKALKIFEETGNELRTADCYLEISYAYYHMQQNLPASLQYMLKALSTYEKQDDKVKMAQCYLFLGMNFYGDTADAFKMLTKALQTFREIKDSSRMAYTHNVTGVNLREEGKHKEAMEHFNIALSLYSQLGKRAPDFGISWTNGNIGDVYLDEGNKAITAGNNVLAREKLLTALKMFTERLAHETEGKTSHRVSYIELGDCNMALSRISEGPEYVNRIAESRKYYLLSLDLAKKSNDKYFLANTYSKLAYLYERTGSYKEAYENYKLFTVYQDSIFNEETAKKVVQTQMQYEFDKKETIVKAEQDKKDAETKRTKNQQDLAISLLGIVVLAVVIIALIQFRNNKQKRKANALLQQQKSQVESTLTELKATQSQLIQSEKMASLGELTAGIAHEIQNPLNFVNNFSEVNTELIDELEQEVDKGNLDEVKALAKDIKENEQKINHHGKRADTIVKGMLQHSRSSNGVKEPTDINTLADEYLRLAFHGLRAKDKSFNATMKTDFDESIGLVDIIPQDIGRVILNLITNAFYAVDEKKKMLTLEEFQSLKGVEKYEPTVSVRTIKTNNTVKLLVTDNGNGIPQKIVEKIFQPFFTTKPAGEGTGLGLSISYDIVKAHGGELKVESEVDSGSGKPAFTNFTLTLPLPNKYSS